MKESAQKIVLVLTLTLVVAVTGLVAFSFYLYKKVDILEGKVSSQASIKNLLNDTIPAVVETQSISPLPTPQQQVQKTNSPIPTTTPIPTSTLISKKYTSYITLVAATNTNSTDWQNITSSEVWIDIANDYGGGAKVYLEASLHADSGKAQVRLYDATHGIGVSGSDIETSSLSAILVSSGTLNLWSGKNLYRVQIKSFDSSKVYIESAKIKVVY